MESSIHKIYFPENLQEDDLRKICPLKILCYTVSSKCSS